MSFAPDDLIDDFAKLRTPRYTRCWRHNNTMYMCINTDFPLLVNFAKCDCDYCTVKCWI